MLRVSFNVGFASDRQEQSEDAVGHSSEFKAYIRLRSDANCLLFGYPTERLIVGICNGVKT